MTECGEAYFLLSLTFLKVGVPFCKTFLKCPDRPNLEHGKQPKNNGEINAISLSDVIFAIFSKKALQNKDESPIASAVSYSPVYVMITRAFINSMLSPQGIGRLSPQPARYSRPFRASYQSDEQENDNTAKISPKSDSEKVREEESQRVEECAD